MHEPSSTPSPSRSLPQPCEWHIEVFYDGGCPLCAREMALIRRMDGRRRIRFTDIDSVAAAADAGHLGRSYDELMSRMHGRLPDGTWVEGVEVFRRLYAAVGLDWLAAASRLPWVAPALDRAYAVFARNRLRLTGRCAAGACATPRHAAAASPASAVVS